MTRTSCLLIYMGLISSLTLPAMAEDATPPNAVDDHIQTDQKTTHIYVLDNDNADGNPVDPSTLSIVSSPTHGDAVVIAKGAVRVKYTVTATESFTDKFRYSICDTAGLCATATVTINYLATPTSTTSTTSTTTTSTTTPPPTSTTLDEAPPPTTPSTPEPDQETPAAADPPDDGTAGESTSTTMPVAAPVGDPPDGPPLPPEDSISSNATIFAAGTTIGDPHARQFKADMLYLGRTGTDTLRMVAMPALMVSGLFGFLMVGLPQNAFGTALGFLVAFRRKREPEHDAQSPSGDGNVP